jgi:hypothetical protein
MSWDTAHFVLRENLAGRWIFFESKEESIERNVNVQLTEFCLCRYATPEELRQEELARLTEHKRKVKLEWGLTCGVFYA